MARRRAPSGRKSNGTRAATKRRSPTGARKRLPLVQGKMSCTTCALCCTYVAIDTDTPNTVERAVQILWFLYHEGVSIYVEDDEWIVQFESRCRHLQRDNRCGIYEQRPIMCREYDEKDCEVNAPVVGQTFTTPSAYLVELRKRHPRVHALLARRYLPDESIVDGSSSARTLAPFIDRFVALRAAVHGPAATASAPAPRRRRAASK